MKPVVKAVPWDDEHRVSWQMQMHKTDEDAVRIPDYAFVATGSELLMRDLPAYVAGVSAVGVAYQSVDDLENDLGIRGPAGRVELPGGSLAGVIGREFFALDDARYDEFDLLSEAVALATDPKFRRKRRAVSEFQEDFLRNGATDRESVERAVVDLRELLDEETTAAPKTLLRTTIRYAFRLAPLGVGLALEAAGVPALSVAAGAAGAFVSMGELRIDERFGAPRSPGTPSPAAFVHDVRKHFGWEDIAAS